MDASERQTAIKEDEKRHENRKVQAEDDPPVMWHDMAEALVAMSTSVLNAQHR